ncbi:MarR family transcriptional regulator [Actinomadura verrucosospora]|uniref:MarR family transcriptional regulator n=2 Tax=Actinomadura verrucosospora TaxID=46165 RepID=A0A7D3VZ01_ACTVE|nr:MarR family transcriptional regulator [Actinomadura verrucosospora]
MRQRGLVTHEASPDDGRGSVIVLTEHLVKAESE